LAGKLSTIDGIAPGLIDLSTVTVALAGKLSATAGIAPGLVDLSTVTSALAGKLSTTQGIAAGLVDLSTVAVALAAKAADSTVVHLTGSETIDGFKAHISSAGLAVTYGLSAGTATLTGGIHAASGTFVAAGDAQFSLETASGVKINAGGVTAPFFAGNGAALTGVTASDASKVAKAGDFMTGQLTTDSTVTVKGDAFSVGTTTFTVAYGNVGIRVASPTSALEVSGTIAVSSSIPNTTTTINWAQGNLQHTALNCQAFTFTNMRDGGAYNLVVKGTTAGTCSFTQGGLTFKMPTDHGATTAAKHTVYTFLVSGTDVYVAWIAGL
jgi:hypothetical protein